MIYKRFFAFIVDIIMSAMFAILIYGVLSFFSVKIIIPMIAIIGWAALICKDCFNGVSVGKLLLGIQVVDSNTQQIVSPQKSIIRNLFYFLSFIDIAFAFTNSKERRLGDYIAHTEVVLRGKSLPKVNYSKSLLAVGYVLIGLIVMEVIYYLRASSLGLL